MIQHSYTPLHFACEKGHAPVVRLLLKAGANKDANDDDGFAGFDLNEFMKSIDIGFYSIVWCSSTPLHLAAYFGHLPVVRLLIDAKAKLDAVDNSKCEVFAFNDIETNEIFAFAR